MVIIINDQKRASGKTTLAKEFLKGKIFLELLNASQLLNPACPFDFIPEWVFIDCANAKDLSTVKELSLEETLTYNIRFSKEKVTMKVPNFLIITNCEL